MDDVDRRVREIADRILDGEWSAKDQLAYARECGVSLSAVKSWTAQAARVLRFLRGDKGEFRERLLANLDRAGRIALELRRQWVDKNGEAFETDAPDVKAFIAAQVEQGRLLRLHERDDQNEGDESVPVEQLAALLRAAGHEVKLNVRSESTPAGATGESGAERGEEKGRVEGFEE